MGAYLSEPVTQKESVDGSHGSLEFGVSGMQGWRMAMEDAHCCLPDIDGKNTAMFGVFDGHGGKEVAEYCSQNIHKFLMDTDAFQDGEIKKALGETFMNIDEAIISEEVIKELKILGGFDNDGNDDEEDEAAMLLEEANMPLGDLLEKLKNSAQEQLDNDALKGNINGQNDDVEDEKIVNGNGDAKPVENGNSDTTSSPTRSRKQKKPVKRSAEDQQTDIPFPNAERKPPVEDLSIMGVALNVGPPPSGSGSSSTADDADAAGSSNSNSTGGKIEDPLDDEHDPEYQLEEEEEECEDEEDYEEDEEEEDDDEDEDTDDEFEDSDGVDFQQGSDEVGQDSGTTAIISVIHKNILYVANVGDSRCVLCRSGQALEQSTDHKPEDTVELNRIETAGAKVTGDGRVNGGLNLSRAIGDHVYKQNKSLSPEEQAITANPDIREIELTNDDEFMVLACDGIWNAMSSSEVVDFVRERLDSNTDEKVLLSKICEELFDTCLSPNTKNDDSGCDNMTCMIVRFRHTDGQIAASTSEKRTIDSEENDSSKSKKLKVSQE